MSGTNTTIIIPVYNAFQCLQDCLLAVDQTTGAQTQVIVLDDASTDARVLPLLRHWCSAPGKNWRLVSQPRNLGFVQTANAGMGMASGNVVLLNSDTLPSPGWLEQLEQCANSDQSIATATPWTNNGEIVSLPQFCVNNPVPGHWQQVGHSLKNFSATLYPDIPTAVGFCMLITRRAIDQAGLFDSETFGMGYGEENDFCMRVRGFGMRNVLCDDAYVVHLGHQSFGPRGLQANDEAMQKLLRKHPHYLSEVQDFVHRDPLAGQRQVVIEYLRECGVELV